MTDVRMSQAANAYQSALKAANKLMDQTTLQGSAPVADASRPSFGDLVSESLESAKQSAYHGEAVSTKGLAGKADLTDVVTAVANAEMALNTVVTIRDRVISAYQDIVKMAI